MKTRKLIKKMQLFLDAERREQAHQRESLQKLLRKLSKRRRSLKVDLAAAEDDAERQRIGEAMHILKVQRQKGLALLEELNETRKGKPLA